MKPVPFRTSFASFCFRWGFFRIISRQFFLLLNSDNIWHRVAKKISFLYFRERYHESSFSVFRKNNWRKKIFDLVFTTILPPVLIVGLSKNSAPCYAGSRTTTVMWQIFPVTICRHWDFSDTQVRLFTRKKLTFPTKFGLFRQNSNFSNNCPTFLIHKCRLFSAQRSTFYRVHVSMSVCFPITWLA